MENDHKPTKINLDELVVELVREHPIGLDEALGLVEEALAGVLKSNYRTGEFRVRMDRETYGMTAWRIWEVIPDDQPNKDDSWQKTIKAAREIDPNVQIGGEISKECDPPNLDRHSNAQVFKKKYLKAVSNLLDVSQLKDGRLVCGTVKRTDSDSGDLVIDVENVECLLPRMDAIPGEILLPGDQIRCLIREIKEDPKLGRMVFLTRTSDKFLTELLRVLVPEIKSDILKIVGVARDPGYCSKIAVSFQTIDQIVASADCCVGLFNPWLKLDIDELKGERVHIILKDQNDVSFVMRSLRPAEIESVKLTGPRTCDVIVKEGNESKAIDMYGRNVKPANRLTGREITILSNFRKIFDVDEWVAQILYAKGYYTIKDLAKTKREVLLEIEQFDEDLVDKIFSWAVDLTDRAEEYHDECHSKRFEYLAGELNPKQDWVSRLLDNHRKTKGEK